jgi:hypothetical protein
MSFTGCYSPGINPGIIIYFCLLLNQGGRFKIIITVGHVLCVLLFVNGFMPFVLIVILALLGSMTNLAFHESMFHQCVTSAACLIILASYLCFSLFHRNNYVSFFVYKTMLQMGNNRKVPKHLFRPSFSVLVIIAIFSMIELVKSTNRSFLKIFVLSPMI